MYLYDDILKKKMLDTFIDINDVFLVIDDRDKAVKMWRDLVQKMLQAKKKGILAVQTMDYLVLS